MQIIPALHIHKGKAAAFHPGQPENIDYLKLGPYQLVEKLDKLNIGHIGLVDIDAAAGNGSNAGLIGSLANLAVADLHVGGGITNINQIKSLQYAGVDYFVIGSAILDNPAFLREIAEADHVPNDRISIALDILDGKLTYHGWTKDAEISLNHLITEAHKMGFSYFMCTDISSEKKAGPDIDFYKSLIQSFPDCRFAASGQIHTFEDVEALKTMGVKAAVVGNEIYKEDALLKRIAEYNKENR